MTLETFFKKFELFADAPDAVAKMRELTLQLAVKGSLVEQRASEPPAIDCISNAGDAVVELTPDPSIPTPDGWVALPLGCVIASNIGGGTPSKANPAFWNGSIPWASVKDVQSDKYLTSTIDSISEDGLNKSSSNLIPKNRLLVVTRMGLGKLAINKVPVAINQDLRAIEPTAALDLDYAYLLFKSLKMVGTGVTVKGITVKKLHQMATIIPPLAEQKRIVAKVDELMALCDRLEAQQQERETRHAELARASLARFAEAPTPANLNLLFHKSYPIPPADLRKSILKMAFDGALTTDSWTPEQMPKGWREEQIASLCVIEDGDRGKAYPKKSDFNESGHCIFLNAKNVTLTGFSFAHTDWITEQKHKELRKGTLVRGDVVFTSRGTLGNIAHFDSTIPHEVMRINSGMFIMRGFEESMEAAFLTRLLRAPQIREQIEDLRSGSAQQQLPIREFRKFTAKIPPLAEQRRIVAKVDQLMALVDQLETQLTTSCATAKNLLEALVAELTTTN